MDVDLSTGLDALVPLIAASSYLIVSDHPIVALSGFEGADLAANAN